MNEIINANQDWLKYLPPDKKESDKGGIFAKPNKGKKKKRQKKAPPQITFDDLERVLNQIRKEMCL